VVESLLRSLGLDFETDAPTFRRAEFSWTRLHFPGTAPAWEKEFGEIEHRWRLARVLEDN